MEQLIRFVNRTGNWYMHHSNGFSFNLKRDDHTIEIYSGDEAIPNSYSWTNIPRYEIQKPLVFKNSLDRVLYIGGEHEGNGFTSDIIMTIMDKPMPDGPCRICYIEIEINPGESVEFGLGELSTRTPMNIATHKALLGFDMVGSLPNNIKHNNIRNPFLRK